MEFISTVHNGAKLVQLVNLTTECASMEIILSF